MVIHIRKRLRRLGGNSWYKDTSIRTSAAVCGGEMTDRDLGYPAKNRTMVQITKNILPDTELCESCHQIVAATRRS